MDPQPVIIATVPSIEIAARHANIFFNVIIRSPFRLKKTLFPRCFVCPIKEPIQSNRLLHPAYYSGCVSNRNACIFCATCVSLDDAYYSILPYICQFYFQKISVFYNGSRSFFIFLSFLFERCPIGHFVPFLEPITGKSAAVWLHVSCTSV